MPNETPASPADEHTQFAQEASAELTQEHQRQWDAALDRMYTGEGQTWALPSIERVQADIASILKECRGVLMLPLPGDWDMETGHQFVKEWRKRIAAGPIGAIKFLGAHEYEAEMKATHPLHVTSFGISDEDIAEFKKAWSAAWPNASRLLVEVPPAADGPIAPAEFRRRGASPELLAALDLVSDPPKNVIEFAPLQVTEGDALFIQYEAWLHDRLLGRPAPATWDEGLAGRAERV